MQCVIDTVQSHSTYQFQRSATAVSGNMPQFRAVAGLQKNAVVANDEERARYFRKRGFEKSDGKNDIQINFSVIVFQLLQFLFVYLPRKATLFI